MMRCLTAEQRQRSATLSSPYQNDMFWRANILSMKKLRKQFDQLTAKKNVES